MATLSVYSGGLYAWTVGLEDGSERHVFAPSATSAVAGLMPSPVVSATRGPAFNAGVDVTPPVLTQLTPSSAAVGSANFTLHVTGTGFRAGDVILWDGGPEATTVVSATEVTADINIGRYAVPMAIAVVVRNVLGMGSNTLTFDLQAAGAR